MGILPNHFEVVKDVSDLVSRLECINYPIKDIAINKSVTNTSETERLNSEIGINGFFILLSNLNKIKIKMKASINAIIFNTIEDLLNKPNINNPINM